MCGFLAIENSRFRNISISPSLRSRGPDEQGFHRLNGIDFNHFRLSIIGGNAGKQPVVGCRYILLYNGEIYDFREIAKKHRLSEYSQESDTFCLYDLVCRKGIDGLRNALSECVGHYAYCIYDEVEDSLYFGRDLMGVKPLYYSINNVAISSDIQAIFENVPTRKNDLDLQENIVFGGLTGERTIYEGIYSCEPGVHYKIKRGSKEVIRYNTTNNRKVGSTPSVSLQELITNSVELQVPDRAGYGCMVSSGIDSRIISALIRPHNDVDLFCISSTRARTRMDDVYEDSECEIIDLQESPSASDINEMVRAYGGIPAHHNFFALALAYRQIKRSKGEGFKILLVGEGADEYFGGYGRYRELCRYHVGFHSEWINILKDLAGRDWLMLMNSRLHHTSIKTLVAAGLNMDRILERRRQGLFRSLEKEDIYSLREYDLQTNLRYGLNKQDVAGMLSGIEVRTPFAIQSVAEESHNFLRNDPKQTKACLRDYALSLGIDQKKKIGFPVNLASFVDSLGTIDALESKAQREAIRMGLSWEYVKHDPEIVRSLIMGSLL